MAEKKATKKTTAKKATETIAKKETIKVNAPDNFDRFHPKWAGIHFTGEKAQLCKGSKVLAEIPPKTALRCEGYFSSINCEAWLYVDYEGRKGFVRERDLR